MSSAPTKLFTTPHGSQTVPHRMRSFVCRNSRVTDGQMEAKNKLWQQVGIALDGGLIDYEQLFNRAAPTVLEIGFGMGITLVAAALAEPNKNFIGVETHLPGIGAVCQGIEENNLQNLKLFHGDVIVVLDKCIPDASLHGVQIFFPDPWPKRRHHPRRLIQSEFVRALAKKIIPGGELHLATDWDDYAKQMMHVMSAEKIFMNLAGEQQFTERSCYRPVLSKFEQRAIREGRQSWDLRFAKQAE